MKSISFVGVFFISGVLTAAEAACPETAGDPQMTDLLSGLGGHTVCVGAPGNWEGQEYHHADTRLIDYKHGEKRAKLPSDTASIGPWNDWTDQVGNWSVTNNNSPGATVNYDYDRNGTPDYSYRVYSRTNGSYYFCNDIAPASTNIHSIKINQVSCDAP